MSKKKVKAVKKRADRKWTLLDSESPKMAHGAGNRGRTATPVGMLTIEEARKLMGYSLGYMYRQVADDPKRFPAFKLGTQTFFRKADIDKALEPVPFVSSQARAKKAGATGKAAKKPAPKAGAKKSPARKAKKSTPAKKASRGKSSAKPATSKGLAASELKSLNAMMGTGS